MISVKIGSGVDATKEVKYTLKPGECGDVTSSDVSAMTSVNWLTVTVADGVITIKTKEANTGKERTGCVTPTIKGEPCDENRIMVTQKETDPEPPKPKECSNFIVNGDDYVVSKDGDRICDSAF